MTTLSEWMEDIAAQVEAWAPTVGIDTVMVGEPREVHGQVVVTISFAGSRADCWLVAVRCYVTGRLAPLVAQERLVAVAEGLVPALDSRFGPDAWGEVEWVDEIQALVATCILDIPRGFG